MPVSIHKYLFLIVVLIVGCHPGVDKDTLVITNIDVIDVVNKQVVPDQTLVIQGDIIAGIHESRPSTDLPGRKIIDGTGKFVIPGLWDMHTHVLWEYAPQFNKLMVANGVTGFREMWGDDSVATRLKKEIREGSLLPQRFFYANHLIDGEPPIWNGAISVKSPDEAVDVVDSLAGTSTDFIKVYSNLSPESFDAIAERCRELGLDMVGHIPTKVKAVEAVKAGMKSTEHLYGIKEAHSPLHDSLLAAGDLGMRGQIMMLNSQDEELGNQLYAELVRHESWQVPTLSLWEGYTSLASPADPPNDERMKYMPKNEIENWTAEANPFISKLDQQQFRLWMQMINRNKEIVGNMADAGVGILAGTDAAVANPYTFPGFSLHDELALLVESGLSNGEALQTATVNPAKYMNATDSLGTIGTGKKADLVILDKNPLEDITNTTTIEAVISSGKYYPRSRLDSLLKTVERKFNE